MYDRFQSRGVVFIGLSSEDAGELAAMRRFLDTHRVKWRNGYGARGTLTQFEARYIPRAWVIGRDGRVVWNKSSRESIEDAIENALAEAPPPATSK